MSLTNTLSYIIIYIVVSCDSHRFARHDVIPAGCPSGSSSTTTSRGSCLTFLTILATLRGKPPPPAGESACRISPVRLLPDPGTLLDVLHPSGAYYTPTTGSGRAGQSSVRRGSRSRIEVAGKV